LLPNEQFPTCFIWRFTNGYTGGQYTFDLLQYGAPEDTNRLIGGVSHQFDLRKLVLVSPNATWRYLCTNFVSGTNWTQSYFDDSSWTSASGPLGFGVGDEAA